MRVAVIGTGNIGRTLGGALARAGHEVVFGSRNPREDASRAPAGSPGAGTPAGPGVRDGDQRRGGGGGR